MLYRLVRPLLFALEPEHAHRRALQGLECTRRAGIAPVLWPRPAGAHPVQVMGLQFPNPVGLAAGLDKNGEHVDALAALGFGFLEIGTVTPRPQPGNPAPRMFRLVPARAIINRMGFNNAGVERLLGNISHQRYRGVLGINIGKNFDTPLERAADDYLHCLRRVYAAASYVTVNISSPNTAGLRDLQQAGELRRLLEALAQERLKLAGEHGKRVPLAVKIAPDLTEQDLGAMAEQFVEYGIDAVVATNTTLSRHGVENLPQAAQAGGLSGAPLKMRATQVVRQLAAALSGRIPIIAAGGILSAADAQEKLAAGARLVQLYTGLIYEGPGLIGQIVAALAAREDAAGLAHSQREN